MGGGALGRYYSELDRGFVNSGGAFPTAASVILAMSRSEVPAECMTVGQMLILVCGSPFSKGPRSEAE